MKKIGIGAGVLLILLVAGALIVPGFIDWNKYKSQIESTASDLSERTVTINGDLSLSILPSPSFSAEDVSVSNVEGGQAQNFITLKSVDVNVAFLPLLRGEIQVKKFILVEPVIAIEVDKNGDGNWQFGASDEDANADSSTTELSFEQFQIENGQISYQDFSTGTQELVRVINASVSMDSLQGPFKIDGSAKYKNLPVSMDLSVGTIREGRKIPINLIGNLLDGDVEFKFSGGILPDEFSPQADGKINIVATDVGNLVLATSLLDLENTNQNGPIYDQSFALESTVAYGGDAINISSFEFEMGESRGSGKLTATFDDVTRFDGDLKVNSFDLDRFLLTNNDASNKQTETTNYAFLDQIAGNFNLKLGALKFNGKIASQLNVDLTANNGALEITNTKLNMPGGSALTLSGVLRAPENEPEFIGDVSLNSGNLRAFLEWLKVDVSSVPTGRLTRLAYSGAVRVDNELIQLYGIDGSLDTFQFKGGISYALQERPAFGIDVTVANLNIDNYLPETSDEVTDYKQSVSILSEFDANYKLELNNVITQGIKIKKIAVSGELFGGRLNARTINVEGFAGFDLNGSLIGSNLASDPTFETSFNTTAASLVPLQRAFRFKTAYDIADVGAVAVNARIKGNFENANIDIKTTVGSSKANIKGEIRSATLKQLPEIGSMNVSLTASNPSLSSLIDQFDLAVTKPLPNDDRPIGIDVSIKGTAELINIDGKVSVAGGAVSLIGRSNLTDNEVSSFDMALDVNSPNVREFIRGLGGEFNPAKADLGTISLKMAVAGNMNDVSLNNIAGNIGPTKLTGNGELKGLSGEPSNGQVNNFDFTLVLDTIPVRDFMEPEPTVNAQEDWGNWSKEPMELAVLNQYEGQINIRANSIIYDDYSFENPRFVAVLKDGVININNFTGKLFGGDVKVAGTFSSAGDLDMNMSLKNATIVDATSAFAGIRPVSGKFNMTQSFKGKGTTQSDLISSLSGAGEIIATPGVINGIDIPKLSESLSGLSNKNGLLGLLGNTLSGGQTPYQGGQSTITTKNGYIQLSPFDIQMLGADSVLNLGINLAEWKMNMAGDMSLSDHPDAPPIGLSIIGALHDPRIDFNTKGLEAFISAKIAASLLQNMIEGNGGLGSLFGGTGGQAPIEQPPEQTPAINEVSPLERFLQPQAPAVQQVEEPEQEKPVEEKKPESVEELGIKLLERLFQKPPSR